ncbi:MAG: DUF1624 domain-containing protein [Prevotella sp.]|nr:DUF1624 domain-containing protein [Prevotella sp.]
MEKKAKRLVSLDVMRGLTVAMMILVNNGYGESFAALQHSKWNGMTPCDLVFPFFLFIVGVSTYLSLSKFSFRPSAQTLRKVFRRAALLFLVGLAIHWVDMAIDGRPLDFAHLRLWAVLQRIALAYLFASLVALYVNHRYLLPVIVGLLATYTVILIFGRGYAYDSSANILAQVDLRLFGYDHLYHKSPVDPEGLLGTIPSVAHVLIGFYCARLMKQADTLNQKIIGFFVAGTVMVFAGYLLSYWLPLNKRIWSPTYVLATCGLAALLQGLLLYLIDGKTTAGRVLSPSSEGTGEVLLPFLVFGMNPLALYVLSELMAILFGHFGISTAIYGGIHTVVASPKWASLCYALTFVALNWLVGYVLYRRRIFIKL